MDINTVNLILWAPFALVGLLAALVYCIKGAVKGWKAALISLAAVLLAALAGIFLARSLAGAAAPAIQAAIPPEAFADLGTAAGMVQTLVLSVVGTLAALAIFMGLFFLLTPILGLIGKLVLGRNTQAAPVTGGSRAAGAAIGLVCALLYALVFLLPVYGSLAAYAPVVRSALDLLPAQEVTMESRDYTVQRLGTQVRPVNQETAPDPQQLLRQILDVILEHPLVEISSAGPVRQAYNTLSQVRTEEAPVNFADMANTMETFMAKYNALLAADDADKTAACRDLVEYCRSDVLSQDWFYGLYAMAMEQAPAMLADMEPEIREVAGEVLEILTLEKQQFQANAEAVLNFAEVCFWPESLKALEAESYEALKTSGLLAEGGKLLNATPEMAALKNLFYRTALMAAAEDKAQQAQAFAEKYPLPMLTDGEQQLQEAEAFCILAGMVEGKEPQDFFTAHPALGQQALQDFAALVGVNA